MECRELTERVVDRLTGQIDPEAGRELEAHLSACAACQGEAAAIGRAWDFLGQDPALEPTAEFRGSGVTSTMFAVGAVLSTA